MNFLLSFNDSKGKGLLIAAIMVTILWVAIVATISLYTYQFKKKPAKAKILNQKILLILMAVLLADLPFNICGWLVGYDIISNSTAVVITLIVLTFVINFVVAGYVVFFLHYLGVAINEEQIVLIGENVKLNRITKYEVDEEHNKFIVHYKVGTILNKKIKWSRYSITGQFINNNKALITKYLDETPVDHNLLFGKPHSPVTEKNASKSDDNVTSAKKDSN